MAALLSTSFGLPWLVMLEGGFGKVGRNSCSSLWITAGMFNQSFIKASREHSSLPMSGNILKKLSTAQRVSEELNSVWRKPFYLPRISAPSWAPKKTLSSQRDPSLWQTRKRSNPNSSTSFSNKDSLWQWSPTFLAFLMGGGGGEGMVPHEWWVSAHAHTAPFAQAVSMGASGTHTCQSHKWSCALAHQLSVQGELCTHVHSPTASVARF